MKGNSRSNVRAQANSDGVCGAVPK
jgi:hypothetical protein